MTLPKRLKPLKGTRQSPFIFYEKVVVESKDPKKSKINGKLAAIMGMSQSDDGEWGYAIHVYGEDEGWDAMSHELRPTGEFDRRETFYSGESIQVRVDKQGRGHIVGWKSGARR